MSSGDPQSQAYEVSDTAEAIEFYYEKGWTDGLPVVPPIEAACAMLTPDWSRDRRLLYRNRQISVTAEKVAINAAGRLQAWNMGQQ
jgi:hypothetical protein